MKWWSHKVLTGLTVWAVTADVVATACAVTGSVAPDSLELLSGNRLAHRKWTHWAPLWGALGIGGAVTPHYALTWVALGSLLHIAQDAMSAGGVPHVFHPQRRWKRLRWYKTGHVSELLVVGGWSLVASFVGLVLGTLPPKLPEILAQMKSLAFQWGAG